MNDRQFRHHLIKLRLERERKEAQAANAAVRKPPATAKPQKAKKRGEDSTWTLMAAGRDERRRTAGPAP